MLIGFKDNDEKHFVIHVPAILAIVEDPTDAERCYIHLAHTNESPIAVHMKAEDVMKAFGEAMNSVQARSTLVGAIPSGGRRQ